MTEFYLGSRERYATIEETSYGSGGTLSNALVIGKDVVVTQNFNQGYQETLQSGADDRKVKDRVAGALSLPYAISFVPVDWRWLKYCFDITSEAGSSPTTHTLDISAGSLTSFKAEWGKQHSTDPLVYLLTGNIITKFTVSFAKSSGEGSDGFIKVNCDVLAQNYTTPASVQSGLSALTAEPCQYRHAKLTLESNEIVEVNNGEITVDQGINPNDSRYANTTLNRTIGEPIPTIARITGRFNLNVKDTTYSTIWEAAAELSGTNSLSLIKTADSDQAVFTLSGVTVSPAPVSNTNLEGVDNADFVFAAESVQVVTKDAVANY